MPTPAATTSKKRNLIVRQAALTDVDGIIDLIKKVYPGFPPYPRELIQSQINHYPEGVLVALVNGKIVGYSASLRIAEEKALAQHTWREITGNGYGSTHEEHGNVLYGYEVCVDPDARGMRIGQRFYNARKKICIHHRLKAIVFAGRIPNFKKRLKEVGSPENYIKAVKEKKVRDSVLSFQLRNGFKVLGVFPNYLPTDSESLGYGVHLIWRNPSYEEPSPEDKKNSKSGKKPAVVYPQYSSVVRAAAVQYRQRKINSFEEFEKMVKYFVDVVSDYKCDFVLFPELFTLQLLSIENEQLSPEKAIIHVAKYSERLENFFSDMAIRYNVNIIAGSHPQIVGDQVQNIAGVYLRDGQIYHQPKIHPTPNERYWWNVTGGSKVSVIPTDCGPIGVLVCYDCEFPELSRHLVNQGMRILFVPFLTDERQSYCRVRYCSQARAVENQIYVVMSGSVGNLPNVENLDIHYAQSCILTPCDFPFARDGIAADTTPNVETVAIADLRIDSLIEARNDGTVQNLKDRRHDLYGIRWMSRD